MGLSPARCTALTTTARRAERSRSRVSNIRIPSADLENTPVSCPIYSMGGWQSTPQATPAPPQKEPTNNNGGDTVVIPVDASKQAEAAFLWYVKHVHRPENIVRVVHCQEMTPQSPMLAEHAFRTESWADMIERSKQQSKGIVAKYEQKLKEHNVRGSVQFEAGKPGETVISTAEKTNANMIVMGCRGFGIVRRTILGSVSEYVIHHTKVPVTVIPKETQNWFF